LPRGHPRAPSSARLDARTRRVNLRSCPTGRNQSDRTLTDRTLTDRTLTYQSRLRGLADEVRGVRRHMWYSCWSFRLKVGSVRGPQEYQTIHRPDVDIPRIEKLFCAGPRVNAPTNGTSRVERQGDRFFTANATKTGSSPARPQCSPNSQSTFRIHSARASWRSATRAIPCPLLRTATGRIES
jgi:hypothetical protein